MQTWTLFSAIIVSSTLLVLGLGIPQAVWYQPDGLLTAGPAVLWRDQVDSGFHCQQYLFLIESEEQIPPPPAPVRT
jgi:hypothetical protein